MDPPCWIWKMFCYNAGNIQLIWEDGYIKIVSPFLNCFIMYSNLKSQLLKQYNLNINILYRKWRSLHNGRTTKVWGGGHCGRTI